MSLRKEKIKKIVFVHDGLAIYPSMQASKKLFHSHGYVVEEMHRQEMKNRPDMEGSILWIMMGFYPKPPAVNTLAVIHEYRSQSLGKFKTVKDYAKKYLNHTPSFRLFQSERIREAFDRDDGVPHGILPLGVSQDILKFKLEKNDGPFDYDFCYIGAISNGRQISEMLKIFLNSYGDKKTIVMVGEVSGDIDKKFSSHSNIIFTGRLSQEDTFALVNASKYAVSYVPEIMPYCYQPPTKLYEYAALGKKILVNNSQSNLGEAKARGINVYIMKDDAFPPEDDLLSILDNNSFDASNIFLENSIKGSGVLDFIEKLYVSSPSS